MARMLSVDDGQPQDVSWLGTRVHTNVWQRSVAGPRMVRRLNVVGHNCEIGLLADEVAYAPEPIDAPAEGNVITCCSQSAGDLVLDL